MIINLETAMKTIKYSRQRESVKDFLSTRRDHPTAETIYTGLRESDPGISLGTVYRNLNLLAELGEIQKLSSGYGPDRFDPCVQPHYHFVCTSCEAMTDLFMEPSGELEKRAAACCSGRIHHHTLFFYGICEKCEAKAN